MMNYRMDSMSGFLDLSLETSMMISGVVYCTGGAICLEQFVVALYLVTITFLSLLLDVLGVWVLYSIFEFVFRMSLQNSIKIYQSFNLTFP
jgi:hypothetical protein